MVTFKVRQSGPWPARAVPVFSASSNIACRQIQPEIVRFARHFAHPCGWIVWNFLAIVELHEARSIFRNDFVVVTWGYNFGLNCNRIGLNCDRFGLNYEMFGLSCDRVKLWQVRIKLWQVRVKLWQVRVKLWQVRVKLWQVRVKLWQVWVKLWQVRVKLWQVRVKLWQFSG